MADLVRPVPGDEICTLVPFAGLKTTSVQISSDLGVTRG